MMATTQEPIEMMVIQQRIRQAVSQAELQQWLKVNPFRAYQDLAIDWLGIVLAFLAVAAIPNVWMYSLAFVAIGTCQYKLFILAHDAIHGALHPQKRVNDRLAKWLVYGPMFMALADARQNHLKHHRLMGTADDPDRYLHTFHSKNTPFQFLLFCSGLATFGKTVLKVTPFGRLLQITENRVKIEPTNQDSLQMQSAFIDYVQQRVPVAIAQMVILGLLWLSPLPLWSYWVLWITPIYFWVFVPDEIRAFCDHAVLEFPDNRGDPFRLVTFLPSGGEALFFSPHEMNYHAEHHLWPSIPHYNLPKAHQFVKDRSEVTVRGSYLAFLWQVWRSLPLKDEN